jgi:hypothetical protein
LKEKIREVKMNLFIMRKYFQLHNYSSNAEAKVAAYHLQGKTSMWWNWLKKVKHLDDKRIYWK